MQQTSVVGFIVPIAWRREKWGLEIDFPKFTCSTDNKTEIKLSIFWS